MTGRFTLKTVRIQLSAPTTWSDQQSDDTLDIINDIENRVWEFVSNLLKSRDIPESVVVIVDDN